MKELLDNINTQIDTFRSESRKAVESGNKSAAVRARRATLELEKLFKQYRKDSLPAAK